MGSHHHAHRLMVLFALSSFLLLAMTASSHAAVPPCPTVPDAYEASDPPTDTDAIVGELRELRRENATTCDAIRAATTETRDAVTNTDARAAVNLAREGIVNAIGDIPPPADSGTDENPAVVKVANGDAITDAAKDAYNAIRELGWLVAGLLIVLIVTPNLRRVIFP